MSLKFISWLRTAGTPITKIAAAGILLLGSQVAAANIWCSGTVNTIYVDAEGAVIFQPSYHASYTQVCNVHGTWQGISSETCYTWYSALLSARIHAKGVLLHYYTTAHTCASLPTYSGALKPSYVMVTS